MFFTSAFASPSASTFTWHAFNTFAYAEKEDEEERTSNSLFGDRKHEGGGRKSTQLERMWQGIRDAKKAGK